MNSTENLSNGRLDSLATVSHRGYGGNFDIDNLLKYGIAIKKIDKDQVEIVSGRQSFTLSYAGIVPEDITLRDVEIDSIPAIDWILDHKSEAFQCDFTWTNKRTREIFEGDTRGCATTSYDEKKDVTHIFLGMLNVSAMEISGKIDADEAQVFLEENDWVVSISRKENLFTSPDADAEVSSRQKI